MSYVTETIIRHLWSVSWQVTILVAIIWLVDRLSFRASPLFRYWLWMIVLIRLCVPVSIELPTGIDTSFINRVGEKVADFRHRNIPVYETGDERPSPIEFPVRKQIDPIPSAVFDSLYDPPSMTAVHKIFFVWYAAFIVICIYISARTLAIIRRLKSCKSVEKPELVSLLYDLSRDMGISRPVKLLYMDNDIGDVPAVVGIFRRGILIPRTIMDTWLLEDIKPILLHELAHIKRMDLLINLLQLVVQAAYFFHPLVWFANRQVLQYREEICDDMAVQALGGRRKHYTMSMVRVMENALREPSLGFFGIGFTERESTVKRRIKRILSDTYKMSTRLSVLSVVLLISIGITGISVSCEKSSNIWKWKRNKDKVIRPPSMELVIRKAEKADSSVVRLNNPSNIIESSFIVIMNSDTLAYGIDYTFDQKTGDFNLLAEESWTPEADIFVMYNTYEHKNIREIILQLTDEGQNLIDGATLHEKNGREAARKLDAAYRKAYKERHIKRIINIRSPVSSVHGEFGFMRRIIGSAKKSDVINRNEINKIKKNDGRITIEIDKNGNILVNGYTVTYDSFEAYLAQEAHKTGNNTIVVRGDVTSKHNNFLKLMGMPRRQELESIATDSKPPENIIIESVRGKKVAEIHLSSTHIKKGTDQVFLNGKPLILDTDYQIDYTTGTVTILNERAMHPKADLVIKYEEENNYEGKELFATPNYLSLGWGRQLRPPDNLKRSVINLVEAVNQYTPIDAKIDMHMPLDSPALFETPCILITSDTAFKLTHKERENLGKYLNNGGFAFIDNATPQYEFGEAEASLRQMISDTLGPDAKGLPIPEDHELFHSFFDFDDGVPMGAEYVVSRLEKGAHEQEQTPVHVTPYIEGIWLGQRLVAIYSDKGYFHRWNDPEHSEPQIKFGVNMVVFAAYQKGGISKRNSKPY